MPPKPKTPVPGAGRPSVSRRTLLLALGGAAVVAAVAIVLSLTLGGSDKKATPPATVNADLSAVAGIPQSGLLLGNPLARVTLTEYVDTSCPICQTYVLKTFPTISREYVRPGKVRVESRVVAFVGPSSARGRELVLAAARQNRAWQLMELLYQNQGDEATDWLTDDLARALAEKVPGLDVDRLFADASGAAVIAAAAKQDALAQADGIQGTPTFVLTTPDGKRHALPPGVPSPEGARQTLDQALAG